MASGRDKLVAPGRHMRRPGRAGLRRVCLATLIMLVVQYGLGIFLNLYVAVPASDAHAGIFAEIATAPLALTVHALLGLTLIGSAILLVVKAARVEDRLLAVLAAAGLTAIAGAFAAGEIFVRNGMPFASLAMAVLTGVALLCYVGTLALATAAQQRGTERPGTERRVPERRAPERRAPERRAPERRASERRAPERRAPERRAASSRQATRPLPVPVQASWPTTPPDQAPASWFARE
jgi:hypothetical protein